MKRAKATKTRTSLPAYLNTLGAMPARLNPHSDPAFLKEEGALGWEGIGSRDTTGVPEQPTIDSIFAHGRFVPFDVSQHVRGDVIARIDAVDWCSTGNSDGYGIARLSSPDPLLNSGQCPGSSPVTDGLHLPVMSAFFDLRWAMFTPGDLSDAIIWAIKTDTDIARSSDELAQLRFGSPTNGDSNHTFVTDGSATYLIKHDQCNERLRRLFDASGELFLGLAATAYRHATDLRSRVLLLRAMIARDDLLLCRYWIDDAK